MSDRWSRPVTPYPNLAWRFRRASLLTLLVLLPSPAGAAVLPQAPFTHAPLSRVLETAGRTGGSPLPPEIRRELDAYLATLAERNPFSEPSLYPSEAYVLAAFANLHVAWAVALAEKGDLKSSDVAGLRSTPFPFNGRTWTLFALEQFLLQRAASEPRLVLFLNPGWAGGPPLPRTALEGHSFAWQIADHASRCGSLPGFWQFDAARRQVRVNAYANLLPGLPPEPAARARRLLDLVPPAPAVRNEVLATCGEALQRCAVEAVPFDERRQR